MAVCRKQKVSRHLPNCKRNSRYRQLRTRVRRSMAARLPTRQLPRAWTRPYSTTSNNVSYGTCRSHDSTYVLGLYLYGLIRVGYKYVSRYQHYIGVEAVRWFLVRHPSVPAGENSVVYWNKITILWQNNTSIITQTNPLWNVKSTSCAPRLQNILLDQRSAPAQVGGGEAVNSAGPE